MAFEAQNKAGFVQGLGAVEILDVPVVNLEVSKVVAFEQVHKNPSIVIPANSYAVSAVSAVSDTGCTVAFADPGVPGATVKILVIG